MKSVRTAINHDDPKFITLTTLKFDMKQERFIVTCVECRESIGFSFQMDSKQRDQSMRKFHIDHWKAHHQKVNE